MSAYQTNRFPGFEQPTRNYYRLPNTWFDLWAWVKEQRNASRLDGPIRWLEYLIKHSWGYLNFDNPVRLTKDEFADGRRSATTDGSRGGRIDGGTGLSSRALVTIPQRLLDLGLIERREDDKDKARIQYYYLPRVRRSEAAPPTPSHSPDTFAGFDEPHSNYFPVPFVWTDLTRDINSGVAILAGEYLMRHTFGWRDRVRWLTPTEIASGRQRRDGSTYDDGIHYPRSTTASACDRMVEEGLFVWRPAQRDIGREKREYALRMRDMLVDEGSGRFLGWAEGAGEEHYKGTTEKQSKPPTRQSKPLTRQSTPLTGQSTDREPQQSTPLTQQSTPLTPQSTPLNQQSTPPTGQSTPRTGSNTHKKHTTKHSDKTHTATQRARAHGADAAADAAPLRHALDSLGINGRKRGEILSMDDPPTGAEAFGWAYYAHAQDWPDKPIGLAIQRLLNPETRHSPPVPFDRFGEEHATPSLTACALVAAYRRAGYATDHLELPDLFDPWYQHFGQHWPRDLPLPNPAAELWASEAEILSTGIEAPADETLKQRWGAAWRAVTSAGNGGSDAVGQLLGYADDVLVILIEDPVARIRAERHREALEARLGMSIQFTAVRPPQQRPEGDPTEATAGRIWEAIARQLACRMAKETFSMHFGSCVPRRFQDHQLEVQVTNPRSLDWIEHRLQPMLTRSVARATEDVTHLRLTTPQGEETLIEITPHLSRGDRH